jgi:acetyltransferase-like isoleucine patch superfamily enzyme
MEQHYWAGPVVGRLWQHVYRRYGVRKNVTIGDGFHLGIGSILSAPHKMTIGSDVYIGKFCTIECDGEIGDYVMVGNNVGLIGRYDHDHKCVGLPIRHTPWIGDDDYTGPGEGLRAIVGDDVWIGYGAVVLSGVNIGRGAIIAAGSVVISDIAPYAIAAGNPARQVGWRFTGNAIASHEMAVYGQAITPTSICASDEKEILGLDGSRNLAHSANAR